MSCSCIFFSLCLLLLASVASARVVLAIRLVLSFHSEAHTAISALIFGGKFSILVARFISEQSSPSAQPGELLRLSLRPKPERPSLAESLRDARSVGALLHSSFSLLAMKLISKICFSECVLCLRKCALHFFYMHRMCW